MILLLSESDVAGLLSMSDGVRVVEQALQQHARGGSIALPRVSADVPGNGGAFRVMSAILPEVGFFGLKTLTVVIRVAGSQGRMYFVILLFDCDGGALRAILAGNRLTGIRTGAATGAAAKYLSRPQSHVLGVIGAGVQSRYQVSAVKEVRPAHRGPRVRHRCRQGRAVCTGNRARSRRSAPEPSAMRARRSRAAISSSRLPRQKRRCSRVEWLEDGTHLSGVGSNTPAKRDLDAVAFQRSRIFVDFVEQALQEAGDLQDALRKGAIDEGAIAGELGEVITGKKAGRQDDRQIMLFKSVGMAIEDVATASFVYQQALASGVGTQVQLDPGNGSSRTLQIERPLQAIHFSELAGVRKGGPNASVRLPLIPRRRAWGYLSPPRRPKLGRLAGRPFRVT